MRSRLTPALNARARAGALALLCLLLDPSVPEALAQTATQADLRALVFYLQQNDRAAVDAEMRRLRRAYPDWRPPADLSELLPAAPGAAGAGPDIAGVWQRIERQDFAGARQLIDRNRRAHPNWSPDPEMLRVLELSEAQAGFDQATAARNAPEAIAIARRVPQLMRCDRINNAWRLASMHNLAGQRAHAVATYRATVTSCPRFADMEPTLQKASEIATPTEMADLFAAARAAAPAQTAALNALEARLRGGAAPPAAATATTAPAPAPARASPAPVAATPFAPGLAPAAASIAAPPAFSTLPLRGDSRIAATRASKEAESWSQCLASSSAPRSLDVLFERSWCALALDRPAEALVGFAAVAARGDGLGGSVPRDVRYGLALAHLSLQMTEEGARIASTVPLTDVQRREIDTIVLDQRAVRAFQLGEFRQAIANFNALERTRGTLRRDLAIMRAYAYLRSGNQSAALQQFETLHAQLATPETRAGLNASRGAP